MSADQKVVEDFAVRYARRLVSEHRPEIYDSEEGPLDAVITLLARHHLIADQAESPEVAAAKAKSLDEALSAGWADKYRAAQRRVTAYERIIRVLLAQSEKVLGLSAITKTLRGQAFQAQVEAARVRFEEARLADNDSTAKAVASDGR